MNQAWKIETRKLSEIYESENNPRIMSKKQAEELEKSLNEFGLCQPIVITEEGEIIGGHQRYRVLKALGEESVAVCLPLFALTKKKKEELAIRLNKNVGDWDWDMLGNLWDAEDLMALGFEEKDLYHPEPEEKEPEKKLSFSVKADDEQDLHKIYQEIEELLLKKSGITYKIKIK